MDIQVQYERIIYKEKPHEIRVKFALSEEDMADLGFVKWGDDIALKFRAYLTEMFNEPKKD